MVSRRTRVAGLGRMILAMACNPPEMGHSDVKQHHVRLCFACHLDNLVTVVGFANYGHIRLGVDQHAETGTQDRMVVSYQYPDFVRLRHNAFFRLS
jgi:hypothetical protein